MQVANEEDEESDMLRTTSIVQQILEKRFSKSREPFEWRKKAEENEREKEKEEKEKEKKEAWLKEEAEPKKEPPKVTLASREVPKNPLAEVETTKVAPASADPPKPQALNMNNPSNRLQYFMELAAKRNASKEAVIKEPPQKKPDLPDTPSSSTTTTTSVPKVPSFFVTAPEPAPKKPQVAATPELKGKLSITSSFKISEPAASTTTAQRKDSSSESQKKEKEPGKILKPFPSPKIFKRDTLKPFKSSNPRHVSCDEEMLTTDATDAEKSELKKSRSKSSSSMSQTESKEGIHKYLGSNTSLNTLGGEGKADTKPLDFLKKQTQRLKGILYCLCVCHRLLNPCLLGFNFRNVIAVLMMYTANSLRSNKGFNLLIRSIIH